VATWTSHIKISNAKNVSHPMQGDEIRALRRLQREKGAKSWRRK
jgi:hypothetical protein